MLRKSLLKPMIAYPIFLLSTVALLAMPATPSMIEMIKIKLFTDLRRFFLDLIMLKTIKRKVMNWKRMSPNQEPN